VLNALQLRLSRLGSGIVWHETVDRGRVLDGSLWLRG